MIVKVNGKEVRQEIVEQVKADFKKEMEYGLLIMQAILLVLDVVGWVQTGHPILATAAFHLIQKAVAV